MFVLLSQYNFFQDIEKMTNYYPDKVTFVLVLVFLLSVS